MKDWYKLSIKDLIKTAPGDNEVSKKWNAFDIKYGNYNYRNDSRSVISDEFISTFRSLIQITSIKQDIEKVLIVGANSGYEVPVFGGFDICATDISCSALEKLNSTYPYVRTVLCEMEKLPFENETFDYYVNLRSIQSRFVNIEETLKEAIRVTKPRGKIIFSIPNAYLVQGNLVKGMWNSELKKFDSEIVNNLVGQIRKSLDNKLTLKASVLEIPSEVFITIKKK